MAKSSVLFECQSCGAKHPKWQGQCDQCGEWNSLVEVVSREANTKSAVGKGRQALKNKVNSQKLISLPEVDLSKGLKNRFSSQIGELDRVLGGGIVPGAVMLLGGEPGIGKSTLLTQLVLKLVETDERPNKSNPKPKKKKSSKSGGIIYVCGEESPSQISLRINRFWEIEQNKSKKVGEIGGNPKQKVSIQKNGQDLSFLTSTDTDEVCETIAQKKPDLVIVDSIQTLSTADLSGVPGSPGQVREAADRITSVVKPLGIPTFIVGHVTKDGTIAGPKVLEHIVDTVLELSGDRMGELRILRTLKNRFGPTDEVGVFRTQDFGLEEVPNPSQVFLEHAGQDVPGSSIVCVLEGSRPLLVEVQALANKSFLAMPRRVGRGIELSRIQVLAAILEKHCGLPMAESDVFVSAAGGFKPKEPSIDLGLAVSMASSLTNKKVPQNTVFIGEIGLLGEIRKVSQLERRIKEAKRLGYKKIISQKSHQFVKNVLKDLGLVG
jgi:DNA repair protein RadA/Sms